MKFFNVFNLKLATFVTILAIETAADDIDKENMKTDGFGRRFLDEFDDENWHIQHLKETDFEEGRRSGCMDMSFLEKVRMYRRNLAKDPALIDYVSADPVPFQENDLTKDTCPITQIIETNKDAEIIKVNKTSNVKEDKQSNKTDNATVVTKGDEKKNVAREKTNDNKSVKKITNETTTIKESIKPDEKNVKKKKKKGKRHKSEKEIKDTLTTPEIKNNKDPKDTKASEARRSEYLISSVEYYDDVIDFDVSQCPDAVDQITLELDILRNYDLECELTLEWRSLE